MNKKQIIKRLSSIGGQLTKIEYAIWEITARDHAPAYFSTLQQVSGFVDQICPKPKIGRPKKPTTQIWFSCPDNLHKRLKKEADKTKTRLSKLIIQKLEKDKTK